MRAGLLTQKIAIWKGETSVTGTGASRSSWVNAFGEDKSLNARVTYNRQNMAQKNGNFVLTSAITFTMRYYSNVNEYMRICWQGRKYRIVAIRRFPERGEMQIDGDLIDE